MAPFLLITSAMPYSAAVGIIPLPPPWEHLPPELQLLLALQGPQLQELQLQEPQLVEPQQLEEQPQQPPLRQTRLCW